MALTQLGTPYPVFTDLDGKPLDDGFLYFGEQDQNPETNPITVYYDAALTQPAAQPIRTSNGYVMRNGSPAILYAGSLFSVTVRNKKSELVIYAPVSFSTSTTNLFRGPLQLDDVAALLADTFLDYSVNVTAGDIVRTSEEGFSYTVAASGAVDEDITTAGGVKLYVTGAAEGWNIEAFGAIGDGATDNAAIFTAVAAKGGTIFVPSGVFVTSAEIDLVLGSTICGVGREESVIKLSGDINGILVNRHNHVQNLRVIGNASMAATKGCIAIGTGGVDSARSSLENVIAGGSGGTLGDADTVICTGCAIIGDHCFLNNFYNVYAYNALFGYDCSKENGSTFGINNAMHWSGCEFHNCGTGFRIGRPKGVQMSACTFENNDSYGLVTGFSNGFSLDACYFEANHGSSVVVVKADVIVDPTLVGETDPGTSMTMNQSYHIQGLTTHCVYVVQGRNVTIDGLFADDPYTAAIKVDDTTDTFVNISNVYSQGGYFDIANEAKVQRPFGIFESRDLPFNGKLIPTQGLQQVVDTRTTAGANITFQPEIADAQVFRLQQPTPHNIFLDFNYDPAPYEGQSVIVIKDSTDIVRTITLFSTGFTVFGNGVLGPEAQGSAVIVTALSDAWHFALIPA